MSSTLVSTCPLCGLGYTNRALLELHIREDHPRHRQTTAEPQHDVGSRAANKMATKTTSAQLRRPRSPSVLEAARRGIHTVGELSRQMAGRIAAMFSQKRLRHSTAARKRAEERARRPDVAMPLPGASRSPESAKTTKPLPR